MIIGQYLLENEEKLGRAINGCVGRAGLLNGGLAEKIRKGELKPVEEQTKEEKVAYEAALLAEYYKLGGLITKNGLKVKSGTFWNSKKRKAEENPDPKFIINIEDEILKMMKKKQKQSK